MTVTLHELSNELGVGTSRLLIELRSMGRSVMGPDSVVATVLANQLRSRVAIATSSVGSALEAAAFGPARREMSAVSLASTFGTSSISNAPAHIRRECVVRRRMLEGLDLRTLREGLAMTVERAAGALGVSVEHLRRVEHGCEPADEVRAILSAYGLFLVTWWSEEPHRVLTPFH